MLLVELYTIVTIQKQKSITVGVGLNLGNYNEFCNVNLPGPCFRVRGETFDKCPLYLDEKSLDRHSGGANNGI